MSQRITIFQIFFIILLILHQTQLSRQKAVTTKSNHDAQIINLIVWICPDPALFAMIQNALQQYRTVDDINKSVQDQIIGYRSTIWLVNTVQYTRTIADTTPKPNIETRNLCFIQAPDEKLIVFVAAVVT